MARCVAVVLLLTLALVPAASAEPPSRGESPFFGWLDAFWGAVDRALAWIPTLRPETRKNGAVIIPSGTQAAPGRTWAVIIPSGMQAATRKNGAMIVPSGIRSVPGSLGSSRLQERARSRQID